MSTTQHSGAKGPDGPFVPSNSLQRGSSNDSVDPQTTTYDKEKRAAMIERIEKDKHAQGLQQDEASIKSMDAAIMREGKLATMVRQTEIEKHAHGPLTDEQDIKNMTTY